ncbi:RNA polymerase sigma factor [Luedemannella helvata]|uniref:RNA polymerase sigma factor n=1 Tax=Luedemannella helvata TaxID=349315 RepID=A0ABN2L2I7_9ACTN
MQAADVTEAVERAWRAESARIVAGVAGVVRDVGLAEELAADALVAALEQWPAEGVPDNPGAWLMLTARRRAIDRIRRDVRLRERVAQLGHEAHQRQQSATFDGTADYEAVIEADDDALNDDLLRLIFVSCHPVLGAEARVALALRVLGGLSTAEIARAFLAPEPTIAQRIVRAKRTLADKRIPFEVPPPAQRAARLASVLEVLYLIFNEGYSATAGDDWLRPALCEEGLRLVRILADLTPTEPEVFGLLALMEIQGSRLAARVGSAGEPIALPDQDRTRWDQAMIHQGFAALLHAERLLRAGDQPGSAAGPYVLQAAIAACHARASTPEETDWGRIAALYARLAELMPTPVVELNRAVALARSQGPAAGLEIVDRLAGEPAMRDYHLLPAVRADLLDRLGRRDEARAEYERAAALTANARERSVLLDRAAPPDPAEGGAP